MSNSSTGWDRLNCLYFEDVVRNVMDSYFAEYGFTYYDRTVVGGIVYSREEVFVEISYEPESCPNYSPRILLGLGQSSGDSNWRKTALPMWFLIPSDRAESKFPFWSFRTKEDLVNVLNRIQAELLEQYAKPLLLDPVSLRKSADAFKASVGLCT
jgi:hypothetical protein